LSFTRPQSEYPYFVETHYILPSTISTPHHSNLDRFCVSFPYDQNVPITGQSIHLSCLSLSSAAKINGYIMQSFQNDNAHLYNQLMDNSQKTACDEKTAKPSKHA